MFWLMGFSVLGAAIVGSASIVVRMNRQRFAVRVAGEMRALLAIPPSPVARPAANELPVVVERYRRIAVGERAPVRTMRLRHGGTFRISRQARPRAIRGVQLFTADPPGFVWHGRVRIFPGLWIDARDMVVAGRGTMRVLVDDTLSLADAQGAQLDQGGALRLLAELVWYPSALFDARTVTWDAVDASHARATLRLGDATVSAIFEFGFDGLPTRVTAQRYDDKGELRAWGGTYRTWRTVAGFRVPFEVEVSWHEDPAFVYAHWLVDSIELDPDPSRVELTGVDRPAKIVAVPLGRLAKTAMVLEVILGVGALGGGLALMMGPRGEVIPLPLSALADSPFATYLVPGALLFVVLGVGPLIAALLSLRRNASAPFLALAVGGALVTWIAVQIMIVGYSNDPPLQALYLGLGVAIAAVGGAWILASSREMSALPPA